MQQPMVYRRPTFAAALDMATRTFDRKRSEGKIPPPDGYDDAGHPVWRPETVRNVVESWFSNRQLAA